MDIFLSGPLDFEDAALVDVDRSELFLVVVLGGAMVFIMIK